jgi:List-Bact-rpt repeat protein
VNVRWIIPLVGAALLAAACGAPAPEFDGTAGPSPFRDDLDARVVVEVQIVGNGSTEQDLEEIRPGRTVRVTAVPGLGSQFVAWGGDITSTDNPVELQPQTDLAITATFEPIPAIGPDFTVNVIGEGWVSRRSGPVAEGDISLRAIPGNGWEFVGWTGMVENDRNPVFLPMREDNEITATFEPTTQAAPVINVWGGLDQRFELGVPQRWVNIRGNVTDSDGITALTYTLNGADAQPLRFGPDERRLQDPGDFNVELDTQALPRGRSEITINATDTLGNIAEIVVTIDFVDAEWPLPYRTDWAAAGSVEDQAQVVDGIWTVGADGIRNAQVGYDRLIAIGDSTWTDYDARFTVRINAADPRGYDATNEPFVGLVMRWPGHTFGEDTEAQPRWYYWPAGSLGGYYLSLDGTSELRLESNLSIWQDNAGDFVMDLGVTYAVRAQVESGTSGALYRLKIWPVDQTEPPQWTVDVNVGSADVGPQGGSLLLIANYFDVTFGDVIVTPLD